MIKRRYIFFIAMVLIITFVMPLCNNMTYANLNGGGGFNGPNKESPDDIKKPSDTNNINTNNSTITEDLLDNLDDFKPGKLGDEGAFKHKVGLILGVLNIVGFIVSVITIMIIGFKYMIGSVEDKASYKKVMLPWIIGAILVFTGTTIPNMLFNIGTSLSDEATKTEHKTPNGDSSNPFEYEYTK